MSCGTIWILQGLSCPILGPGQGELWDQLRALRTDPAPFWDQVKVSCGISWEPCGLILPFSVTRSRWAAGPSENHKEWFCPFLGPCQGELREHLRTTRPLFLPFSGTKSRWAAVPSENYKLQGLILPLSGPSPGELRDHLRTTMTDPVPPPLSGKRKCGSLSQTEIESFWNHKIRRFSLRARGKPAKFWEQLVCINWLAFSFRVRAPLSCKHVGLFSTLIVMVIGHIITRKCNLLQ